MAEEGAAGASQSTRFLLLYALAVAGGAVAYVPLLTILLPVRVEGMAGGASITWLAYIAFAGAISASLSNIAFGWLSDITRNRRGWIAGGMIVSSSLLLTIPYADTLPMLIGILVAWQLTMNAMLGPLSAWGGDTVPDHQKGLLGGLLACAPALGALSGLVVTMPGLAGADTRLAMVAGFVILCVSPALLFGAPRSFPELTRPRERTAEELSFKSRSVVVRMWLARLLVQIGEAALFAYLYLWLRSISPEIGDNDAAKVFGVVLVVAVPATLLVGKWADRYERPILPLGIAAGVATVSLLIMAAAPGLVVALIGYALFGLAAAIFLALHSAQTLRVLPRPQHRGRDLGVFNLTNTVPSVIMPGMTLALMPLFGFSGLFIALALLTASAALLLVTAKPVR